MRERKLDFDDMILCCYELLSQRKDILNAWQKKICTIFWWMSFRISIILQYDIVQMLAAPENNLFIVGDDDQSIYHFRGARPEIMLNFTEDYPKAETVLLNVNYRCSGEYPAYSHESDRMIMTKRFKKQLDTPNEAGDACDRCKEFR